MGIEEELSARDTGLMLSSLELRGQYDPALVFPWIRDRRVDGLVLAKSQRRERALLKAAVEAQLPTVIIAPDEIFPDVQVVRCNNTAAGTTVGAHLAASDIAGSDSPAVPSTRSIPSTGCAGCATSWRAAASRWSRITSSRAAATPARPAASSRTASSSRGPDLTALVLANDALAFGFMRVALQRGIRMPHDLSVIGFDGLPHGALFCPALTTVSQPMRDMGRIACCRLFEAIENPGRIETTEFPMALLERESTGPAPGAGSRLSALRLVTPPSVPPGPPAPASPE